MRTDSVTQATRRSTLVSSTTAFPSAKIKGSAAGGGSTSGSGGTQRGGRSYEVGTLAYGHLGGTNGDNNIVASSKKSK